MSKNNQKKPEELKKPLVIKSPDIKSEEQKSVDAKNALDSFINSDNTDIDNKKDEAKLNDFVDLGEEPKSEELPQKLKDLPRKYWKHQTV